MLLSDALRQANKVEFGTQGGVISYDISYRMSERMVVGCKHPCLFAEDDDQDYSWTFDEIIHAMRNDIKFRLLSILRLTEK